MAAVDYEVDMEAVSLLQRHRPFRATLEMKSQEQVECELCGRPTRRPIYLVPALEEHPEKRRFMVCLTGQCAEYILGKGPAEELIQTALTGGSADLVGEPVSPGRSPLPIVAGHGAGIDLTAKKDQVVSECRKWDDSGATLSRREQRKRSNDVGEVRRICNNWENNGNMTIAEYATLVRFIQQQREKAKGGAK